MSPGLSCLVAPDWSDVRIPRQVSAGAGVGIGSYNRAPNRPQHDVGGGMTRDEILAFFDERQVHWRTRDVEGLAQGHAPTGVVISPMFGRRSGRDAIRHSYVSLF